MICFSKLVITYIEPTVLVKERSETQIYDLYKIFLYQNFPSTSQTRLKEFSFIFESFRPHRFSCWKVPQKKKEIAYLWFPWNYFTVTDVAPRELLDSRHDYPQCFSPIPLPNFFSFKQEVNSSLSFVSEKGLTQSSIIFHELLFIETFKVK